MTTLATGLIGAAVGGVVGVPGLGFSLGAALGQSFLGGKGQHTYTHQEGSRLSDLKVQSSQVGMMIPIVYGTYRIAGNIIWATDIIEHSNTTTQTQHLNGGGKGGHHHDHIVTQTTTNYSYSVSFALGLCQGIIFGIRRIWADGKLIYNTGSQATAQTLISSQLRAKQLRLYKGTENQLPDPLIEAHMGAGQVPAFRGLAYLVFEDLQLAEFGNRLPNITVEVVQVGEHTRNLSHVAIQIEKPFNEAVGNLSYFDGGVIHTQLGGEGWNQPPERVDLDLNLNVIQRFRGAHTQPGECYQPIIKYMPNLFLKSRFPCAWYDVVTGQHAPIEPYVGEPLTGVYANHQVYCIYGSRTGSSHAHLVHYQVGSPYEIPKTVISKIMGLQQTFGLPQASMVDIDIRHGYLFATAIEQQTPKLFAFDPISSKLIKKWTLQLSNAPFDPRYRLRHHYHISLNSDSTKALLTHREGNLSQAFLVALDFDAETLYADPNELYQFEGNGYFSFLTDDLVYVGGLGNQPHQTKAIVCGVHALEPSKLLLADLIVDVCQKAGISKNIIHLTPLEIAAHEVNGFVLSQATTLRECLLPLQQAYHFDIVESGFTLQFVARSTKQKLIHIDSNDLAAQEYGQAANSAWIETHSQPAELPQCVNLLFADIKHNYQQGHQSAKRSTTQSQQTQTIELPIALTQQQATQIANTLLYEAWGSRTRYEFSLSRKYAFLNAGDFIHFNHKTLRLTSIAYGDPGLVKVKAVQEDVSIYPSVSEDESASWSVEPSIPEIPLPSPTQLYLLDIPILHDEDDDTGFYAAASHLLPHWPGAVIAESKNNGQTFKALYSQNHAATVGITQNVLLPGKTTIFDEENSLMVKLSHGELSSTTEFNVLNGENLCLVGQEILQFQNATLQPDGSYQLTQLLRGRRGTEWAVNTHQISEPFILLDSNNIHRIKSSAADIGLLRIYKAITFGRSVVDTTPYSFINTAVGKKPLSPVHVQGICNPTGDLTLTWIPRTRLQGAWRDGVDATKDPEIKSYEIDIVKEQVVIRTLTSMTEEIIYTAEQQIADFGNLQKSITLKLYAIGHTVGRGFPLETTV